MFNLNPLTKIPVPIFDREISIPLTESHSGWVRFNDKELLQFPQKTQNTTWRPHVSSVSTLFLYFHAALMLRMAHHRAGVRASMRRARRLASSSRQTSHRGENPSCTDPTAILTCRQSLCPETHPLQAIGKQSFLVLNIMTGKRILGSTSSLSLNLLSNVKPTMYEVQLQERPTCSPRS